MGPLGQPELLLQKHTQHWNWCGGYHPAVIYFPRNDIAMAFLNYIDKTSHCIHKGYARYFSIITKNKPIENVAWTYENPKIEMAMIKDHLAFCSNDKNIIEHL
jgi:uncharacterized protein (DUF427 family)|tara:strand:+ start:756 stop:1064 length:309 start_codon:yes stop_codon:yes gene_type:complete